MEETGTTGKRRLPPDWLYGLLAALAAAAAVLGAGAWLGTRAADREAERLLHYWAGYGAAHYQLAGSWSGIETQVAGQWEQQRQLGTERLRIWQADGRSEVLSYGSEGMWPDSRRRMPVVAGGRIVGYVAAEADRPAGDRGLVALLAAAAALAVGGVWQAAYRRLRSRTAGALHAVAARASQLADVRRPPAASAASWPDADAEDVLATAVGYGAEDDVERGGIGSRAETALRALERVAAKVERLETVRSSMVADIAHELRTPLAVMRAQLEQALLAGQPLTLDKLATLHDETYRMSKLVRDMQELALAESGRLRLEKGWCAAEELLEGIVDVLGADAEERGIAVDLEVEDGMMLFADPVRLQQVVINLVGNAIRHARSRVRVAAKLSGNGEAQIDVADDGYGIEREELPLLFERFYRGHTSAGRQRKDGGLGLGLAIAREYAAAHGGTVEADSTWGEGATFTIRLPVFQSD